MSDSVFDVEVRWPELFALLTAEQRSVVIEAMASTWHEGWEPNREDVENIVDHARGAIGDEEYLRRADAAAERRRVTQPPVTGLSPTETTGGDAG